MQEIEYDCWSNDGECFDNDICTILDIHFGNIDTYKEAVDSEIYTGVSVKPNITGEDIAENATDYIKDQLHDLCGEYSDRYEVSNTDFKDLRDYLNLWIAKQNFNCYGVKNVKCIPVIDCLTKEKIKEYYE